MQTDLGISSHLTLTVALETDTEAEINPYEVLD